MPIFEIFLIIIAFAIVLISTRFLVSAFDKISQVVHLSRFKLSLIFLGLLTSIPELSIGINASLNNQPDIYIGNLLGGIVIIFLLIIPLLAIFGKGLKIDHSFSKSNLIFSLLILLLPAIIIIDHTLTIQESILLIVAYFARFVLFKNSGVERTHEKIAYKYIIWPVIISLLSITSIFLSGNVIVHTSSYLSSYFRIPEFIMGLLFLTIGTNLPELSIGIEAIRSGKKDLALGDYIGSAMANVLILGICGLIGNNVRFDASRYSLTIIFLASTIGMFYIFAKSQKQITKQEGYLLATGFVIFALMEVVF